MRHGFNLRPAAEALGISIGVQALVGVVFFGAAFWIIAKGF